MLGLGVNKGGEIVVVGTPETVAEHLTSHTGQIPQASAGAASARGGGGLRGDGLIWKGWGRLIGVGSGGVGGS